METLILFAISLVLLLGGIGIMRYGLKGLLGVHVKLLLSQLTCTPWRGLCVGIAGAALMQSSTALSLITIGFVSAELLTFHQGLSIILGANIGTCTTVQLLSLSLPDEYFLPVLLLSLSCAAIKKIRCISLAVSGLSAIFAGLSLMAETMGSLSNMEQIMQYIQTENAPGYGILGGILITALFQSSSAATGLLMTLAQEGLLDLTSSTYVVYGNNIGSCLSSLVVGSAAPLAARRVAISHIALNVVGVLAFFPFTGLLTSWVSGITQNFSGQIALVHTIFNIVSSLAIMPFIRHFATLITWLVPSRR